MRRRRSVATLAGFIVLPMLSALSPLIALPAVTSEFGVSAWTAIAIGQSIGSGGAVIVELGWGLNGPQRIARASAANRRRTLATALTTKLVVFAPIALSAALLTALLSPAFDAEAVAVAVGAAAVGMSSSWFFIGIGAPLRIALTDSLPRLVAVALAAYGMSSGGPLLLYSLAVLVPSLLAPALSVSSSRLRRRDFSHLRPGRVVWCIRAQSVALSARAVSALYIALPVALVSVVAPQAVPVFAAAERLQRMALALLQSIPNFLQGWVGRERTPGRRLARANRALLINASVGLLAGTVFALTVPYVASFLFSGVAPVPFELSALSGLLILVVSCSRATGNISLVALRRLRVIATSSLAGAIVGVPAILVLAHALGPAGAVLGEIAAEVAVLTIQGVVVWRASSGDRR